MSGLMFPLTGTAMGRGMTHLIGELGRENEDPLLSACWASLFRVRPCQGGLALSSCACDWLGKSVHSCHPSIAIFFSEQLYQLQNDVLTLISLLLASELGEEGGGQGWWSQRH